MKGIKFISVVLALYCLPVHAREKISDEKTDSLIRTVPGLTIDSGYIRKFNSINDYSTFGIQYGAALSIPSFQPVREHTPVFEPINFGILYTRYGKMFGYMPYFGFQAGLFYTQEGYHFTSDKESGYTYYILGARKVQLQTLELPVLALLHYDFWKMRLMVDVGLFGGYRWKIERSDYAVEKEEYMDYRNSFHPKENRWDYGIKAGGGLALLLDPVEIHITCNYKYSWSNLHKPNVDYKYDDNKYYYTWAYPTNVILSVGVHYQLTRRVGTMRKVLKQQAREEVDRMLEELRQKEIQAAADSTAVVVGKRNAENSAENNAENSAENNTENNAENIAENNAKNSAEEAPEKKERTEDEKK